MLNPYAPHEPASVLFEEETWLQGCILGSVFYGVQLALFAGCVHLLWAQMTRANRRRHAAFIAYVCVMFALGTIFMVCNAAFTQFAFVTHREYPGGPSAVENDFLADPSDESGNVAFVIQCWLADALLVWRCTVIYTGSRVPTWAVALGPILIWLGSIVAGTLWLIQVSASSIHVHTARAINWTLPFLALTIALNVLVTLAIVGRIQLYRLRLRGVLGARTALPYTSASALVVESAALYSAFALMLLVTFARGSAVFNVFLQSMSQVQICATFLIIYRVAQGRAWTEKTNGTVLTCAKGPPTDFACDLVMPEATTSTADHSHTFVARSVKSERSATEDVLGHEALTGPNEKDVTDMV